VGVIQRDEAARFSINVVLIRQARVVATQVVPGGTAYHFPATPGTYVLSSNAQYVRPVQVTLRSGEVARVDLIPPCK
jgi:hypothetical protein